MRNKSILLFLSTITITAASCGSGEKSVPEIMGDVGPNEVRILGHLVEIDTMRTARETDPCSKMPCRARVRIDSVLGYGAAFPRPLSKGEVIDARFAFTLGPSAEAFPDLDETYPGLKAGDSFWADLEGRPAPGGPRFVVYGYQPRHD